MASGVVPSKARCYPKGHPSSVATKERGVGVGQSLTPSVTRETHQEGLNPVPSTQGHLRNECLVGLISGTPWEGRQSWSVHQRNWGCWSQPCQFWLCDLEQVTELLRNSVSQFCKMGPILPKLG